MTGIWTVARQTFVQCLRMRMTLVFVIMLSVGLTGVGLAIKGDGTLNGRVRTFLDYSFVLAVLVPGIMTIFLTVGMVAGDVRRKQIFMIITKPLSRWHYVLGRWLGVMFLNMLLLILAGGGIYAMVQYLKALPALNQTDRRALMNEVLTARERIPPYPFDISGEMEKRIKALIADSRRYEQAIEAYQTKASCTKEQAEELIKKEITKQIMEEVQTVGPSQKMGWMFPTPDVQSARISGKAKILSVNPNTGQVVAEADDSLLSQMVGEGPIEIEKLQGVVAWYDMKKFEARFEKEAVAYFESRGIAPGRSVPITIDPSIQLNYKPVPTGSFSDMPYSYGIWRITNEKGSKVFWFMREDPTNQEATLTIPASAAYGGSVINAQFQNLNNPADPQLWRIWSNAQTKASTLRLDLNQISLLYRVGSFEMNFIKAILLVLIELAFLAALGSLFGSFLSLPVGSVFAMVLLLFGRMQEFALMAASTQGGHGDFLEDFNVICGYFLRFLAFVAVPDLSAISPEEHLSAGIRIPWSFVSVASAAPMLARCAIMLAVACLIFTRREVGKVQV